MVLNDSKEKRNMNEKWGVINVIEIRIEAL